MTARRSSRRPLPARLLPRRAPALDPELLAASLRLQRPLEPVHEPEATVLPPGSGLPIRFKPNLLRRAEDRLVQVPEGLSLTEIVDRLVPAEVPPEQIDLLLNGEVIPPAWWPRVRPRPAAHIEIALLPAGGSEILRAVLIAGVVIAVAAAMPWAIGVVGPAAAAGLGAGVTVGAALTIGGEL